MYAAKTAGVGAYGYPETESSYRKKSNNEIPMLHLNIFIEKCNIKNNIL